jgi:hypothetical protein
VCRANGFVIVFSLYAIGVYLFVLLLLDKYVIPVRKEGRKEGYDKDVIRDLLEESK